MRPKVPISTGPGDGNLEGLRYFFLQAPIPYQSLDETGCLLDVNPAWLETLGYQREEVLGRSFGEFLHPEWTEVFARRFPVFKTVGEILGVEFDMIKKDGAFITVSFSGQIEAGPDGQFRRTHCIFEDITNHKADQAEGYYRGQKDTAAFQQLETDHDDSKSLATVGFVAGGVLVAGGVALLLWPDGEAPAVSASVGPEGMMLVGSF